jgi:DNA mismatch endonuclease, patch repair protein
MIPLPEVAPERSAQMALVRGRDTKPEMLVRRLVHSLRYRYRLHCRELPGTPDLVFRVRRKVIFVHGCFWHMHQDPNCWRARLPKTHRDFWIAKLEANTARDARDIATLKSRGWAVMVIWECQTRPTNRDELRELLTKFLG